MGKGCAKVERGLSESWAWVVRGVNEGCAEVELASLDNKRVETYTFLNGWRVNVERDLGKGWAVVERELGEN